MMILMQIKKKMEIQIFILKILIQKKVNIKNPNREKVD